MAERIDLGAIPQATVVPGKRTRISAVWIIPVLALVVAVGIAIQRIANEGPEITLVFQDADGMEAGKTHIKYKDVSIGQVTAVRLSDDLQRVELTAKIDKSAAGTMVEDATFWVVSPRVTLSGVSGLNTLLSGNYIGFAPGKSKKRSLHFTGLETPPAIAEGSSGSQYVLKAQDLGSVGIGSPIYFRRLTVGRIIGYDLAPDGKSVQIQIFIDAPHHKYVQTGTRFWNASGLNVSFGANGVDIRTESFLALLEGGLAFDTPAFESHRDLAPEKTEFTLFRDEAAAMKQPDAVATPFVLHFNESVRGLSVGAPVTLYGLQVGEVTDVGLTYDSEHLTLRTEVKAKFFLQRLTSLLPPGQISDVAAIRDNDVSAELAALRRMVQERKMRAQLQSGNLISGQLFVALDFFPDAPDAKFDWSKGVLEMPVLPSTLPNIEAKLTSIVDKLDKLPFEALGKDLEQLLGDLEKTLDNARSMLTRADAEIVPEVKATLTEVNSAVAELRGMIGAAERVLTGAESTLVGPDAPAQQELREVLQEVARAARSFRVLTDYLERHPEALIRGKTE